MINKIYTLPEIQFIGGTTQNFCFTVHTESGALYTTLDDCDITFSVISYVNRDYGSPIILYSSKDDNAMVTYAVNGDGEACRIIVKLDREATFTLSGKFIYQIEITDASGKTESPGQGIMTITRNIGSGYRIG